ncbi:DUF6328 family protein [Zhihengliuella sp.]|uniref:DUF6328 family protein n=1 Tax=Zhihengliuella sp. TaxID=1954483 RepID=UPI002810AE46|nr:DUF6328 family protein [Zhihengliuella sp.]
MEASTTHDDGDRHDGRQLSNGRHETPDERADRNWNELLQELRVMQTGAQILTAFLMTLPFQSRFTELSSTQHGVYIVLLVASVLITGLIMTPVAIHRRMFRRHVKEQTVEYGHHLVRVALVGIGLVVSLAVFFIVDIVVSLTAAWWIGGGVLAVTLFLLTILPAVLRSRQKRARRSA